MMNINNKVVLITGCSSGFGNITSKLLAENGYKVYAGIRNKKDLQILKSIKNLKPILLDITWTQSKINKTVSEIINKEKQIDVLINNAGFALLGLSANLTERELKDQFETNFFGQFKITISVLQYMRKRKSGLVIMVNSISGIVSTAFYGAYSASKFALDGFTTALRFEESANGINIVSINPGSHTTNFWKNIKWAKGSPEVNKKIKNIVSRIKWHRHNPINVARKIKSIIESEYPKKNYLIGINAVFTYFLFEIIPYDLIDWFGKKIVRRIIKS